MAARKDPADARMDGDVVRGATRGVSGRSMRRALEKAQRTGKDRLGRDESFTKRRGEPA